ncbi:glyoxalase [Paenibacillus sp. D9]|uniref:VOC family protein n=1 Tax=Paenibacillus TaxID=44249 RepID=UPI0003F738AA|nr:MULTISPECIES: VOC family protein [Paenibacillus]KKC47406.1 glyoxalase [Paenibacillus sp. D9]
MTQPHLSIHPGVSIGLVKLKVKEIDRSVRFYTDIIGFQVLRRDEEGVWLTAGGPEPLLLLEERPDAVPAAGRTAGLYHFAILVPDRLSLGLVLRRLAEARLPVGQGDHWVSEALYLDDPDGNGIEIYRDRPRSEWKHDAEGHVLMGTDPVDVEGLLQLAEGQEWQGLPAGTVIGHVHFHVSDLQAAYDFYCGLLGFDLIADGWQSMGALFVSAGGYHHHIGLNIWAGKGAPPAPERGVGLAYATILYPDAESLAAAMDRLRDGGAEVRDVPEGGEVTDPSGIRLRLASAAKQA